MWPRISKRVAAEKAEREQRDLALAAARSAVTERDKLRVSARYWNEGLVKYLASLENKPLRQRQRVVEEFLSNAGAFRSNAESPARELIRAQHIVLEYASPADLKRAVLHNMHWARHGGPDPNQSLRRAVAILSIFEKTASRELLIEFTRRFCVSESKLDVAVAFEMFEVLEGLSPT